mmetsp:Transcript_4315/g.7460  ORF Transcript_4315/g.7460 Transcript_4315/m.7460 type:complete len:573 (-) Transcript_4315:1-1719(-)
MPVRLSFIFLGLAATATALSHPVTSKLMIHIPQSLSREGGYDHREALFGFPRYGGSIAQNVVFVDSNLCSTDIRSSQIYPMADNALIPPYIMMVNRGECTFVTKVRNAQKSGAAAVLIADTTCLCRDSECVPTNPNVQCEEREPTMADDGSGSDISIPSFLLFKKDADIIKDVLLRNQKVQVEMSWSLPTPDARVEYALWSVPTDYLSKEFLYNFKDIAAKLGDRASFTPHMYIYDGRNAGCVGGDLECGNLCTNMGRYCATDPDNDLETGISGADVVRESLRRLCIWQSYGKDGIGMQWWFYVEEFYDRCHTMSKFTNQDCISEAMRRARISEERINQCMTSSGGLDLDTTNAILETEITARSDKGIFILPTATVNNVPIRGALTTTNIFDAICSGYAAGTIPVVCQQCAGCTSLRSCVNNNGMCYGGSISSNTSSIGGKPQGKVSTPFFLFCMMVVAGGFAGGGFWYYKRQQEEMRDHVRGILAEYMPLDDQDGGAGGGMMRMNTNDAGGSGMNGGGMNAGGMMAKFVQQVGGITANQQGSAYQPVHQGQHQQPAGYTPVTLADNSAPIS